MTDKAGMSGVIPFIGRDDEVRALRGSLEKLAEGHGAAVMLAGEAGAGKSRLMAEFAAIARESGAITLRGHCTPEWPTPYGPFAGAIGEYVKDAGEKRTPDRPGLRRSPLSRAWFPSFATGFRTYSSPESLPPADERVRLLDVVAQFLVALSGRSPVVVILDDLHWADEGTLGMLRSIARETT